MSHGEKERTEDYKEKRWKSRRHRRCTEQRRMFANSISNLYTKRLPLNSYQESVRYTSVALCAVGTSVTLRYLRSLRDSVCLIYKTFSLSLHISEEPVILPSRHIMTCRMKFSFRFLSLYYCSAHNVRMLRTYRVKA